MKIDKIVFSCSEEFSPFWNIQSFLWKEKLGIEPVCLLWGKQKNTNMSDKYGEIIENEYDPSIDITSFQLTWSKFFHTSTEPDTTWMIGDIDLVPLSSDWFWRNIATLPVDVYTHLAYGGLVGLGSNWANAFHPWYNADGFLWNRFVTHGGHVHSGIGQGLKNADLPFGCDLPAYYHVAKGSTFTNALGLDECSFTDQVKRVIDSNKFGMGVVQNWPSKTDVPDKFKTVPIPPHELYYWVADENYSSYRIYNAMKNGKIRFAPHITPWTSKNSMRLDRMWMNSNKEYITAPWLSRGNPDTTDLKEGRVIDVHCHRPYEEQESGLKKLVEIAWDDWFE